MKKLELRQLIKEEIRRVVKENDQAGIPNDVPSAVKKMWNSGQFVRIEPSTQLQVGDSIVSIYSSTFFTIKKVMGDIITIVDDAYGKSNSRKRDVIEMYFLIRKK